MRLAKLATGLIFIALVFAEYPAPRLQASGRAVSGEIVVQFRRGVHASARADAHRQAGGSVRAEIARRNVQLVRVAAGKESAALALYQRHPNVLHAEPNFLRSIPQPTSDGASAVVPGDYYFPEQYALHNTGQLFYCLPIFTTPWCFYVGTPDADIDAPEAWAISQGNPGIKVAVIDSGVDYTHPDLAPNFAGGYDFFSDDADPMDDHGHGTHVAGTIAAAINNPTGQPASDEGVVGVAPRTQILAYKVCGVDGSCSDFAIQQALARAISDGAKVVNLSLGSADPSESLNNAVQDAWSQGLVIVAGAGNNGTTGTFYPAAFDNVISVAAFDEDHRRASFSNYGPWVDVSAPGNVIMSSYLMAACAGATPSPGDTGCYNWLSGTSMATPHVSGAAALVWSLADVIDNRQVVDILLQSADPAGVQAEARLDSWTIHGGLNIHNALSHASSNRAPVADPGGPYSGTAGQPITFDGTGSSDPDGDALVHSWDFGDGSQATSATPTHTYQAAGTFTVTLSVHDQHDGTHTVTTTAAIAAANQPPIANAGPDRTVLDANGNGTEEVTLNGSGSSDSDGDVLTYTWSEGTQLVATGATPTIPLAVGIHTLTLSVVDSRGLGATDTVVIVVQAPADSVAISKAAYTSRTRQLTVEATSSHAPEAVLTVFDVDKPSVPIGTLAYSAKKRKYSGIFAVSSRPAAILVVSSLGGSATISVGGK